MLSEQGQSFHQWKSSCMFKVWGKAHYLYLTLPSVCKTKGFIAGSGGIGAVTLMVIFTFIYPSITENADAIVDLRIEQGIIKTTQITDSITLETIDENVNKLILFQCIEHPNHLLCN